MELYEKMILILVLLEILRHYKIKICSHDPYNQITEHQVYRMQYGLKLLPQQMNIAPPPQLNQSQTSSIPKNANNKPIVDILSAENTVIKTNPFDQNKFCESKCNEELTNCSPLTRIIYILNEYQSLILNGSDGINLFIRFCINISFRYYIHLICVHSHQLKQTGNGLESKCNNIKEVKWTQIHYRNRNMMNRIKKKRVIIMIIIYILIYLIPFISVCIIWKKNK